MNQNKREMGKFWEEEAEKHLTKNGYKTILRNFRIGKIGEIDIISFDGEYLCFIEVKARTSINFGSPAEAVTYRKQSTIRRIASAFAAKPQYRNNMVRFDVVEVFSNNKELSFNIIKNAF